MGLDRRQGTSCITLHHDLRPRYVKYSDNSITLDIYKRYNFPDNLGRGNQKLQLLCRGLINMQASWCSVYLHGKMQLLRWALWPLSLFWYSPQKPCVYYYMSVKYKHQTTHTWSTDGSHYPSVGSKIGQFSVIDQIFIFSTFELHWFKLLDLPIMCCLEDLYFSWSTTWPKLVYSINHWIRRSKIVNFMFPSWELRAKPKP